MNSKYKSKKDIRTFLSAISLQSKLNLTSYKNFKVESVGFFPAVREGTRKMVDYWVTFPGHQILTFWIGKASRPAKKKKKKGKIKKIQAVGCKKALQMWDTYTPFLHWSVPRSLSPSCYICCAWYALLKSVFPCSAITERNNQKFPSNALKVK